MGAAEAAIFLDMTHPMSGYVARYLPCNDEDAPGSWIDLYRRATPEEAFERLDAFAASWGPDPLPQLQVVRREVTDTVITDPRTAEEPEEATV
jgi:hypothetical protein